MIKEMKIDQQAEINLAKFKSQQIFTFGQDLEALDTYVYIGEFFKKSDAEVCSHNLQKKGLENNIVLDQSRKINIYFIQTKIISEDQYKQLFPYNSLTTQGQNLVSLVLNKPCIIGREIKKENDDRIFVNLPDDVFMRRNIDRVAKHVAEYGSQFEMVIILVNYRN